MNIKSTNPQILIHTGLAVSKSTNAEDAAIQPAKPSSGIQSLQEHDKKYHPNGWKRGDSCKLRDSLFSDANGVDNLTPSGNTTNHVSNSQRMPTKDKYDSAIDGIEAYEDFLPKDVLETIREYPKKSTELAETIEELQGIVNDIPDSNARKIGLEEIKNKEKEWADLQTRFLAAYEAIDGVFNTGTASSSNGFIPQYKPLEHKEKNFPKKIDSVVDDGVGGKIVTINGIQYNFSPAGGSTGATKGVIDIGGKKQMFFLKTDNSTLTADAVRNEFASDEFLRSAGVNAPDGMLYSLGNGHIAKLTTEVPDVIGDLSNGVDSLGLSPTQKKHLVEKLREAYPLLDVMYHTDAFKNDNILVDKDANPWFVDNGSSFLYRARGGLKDSTWGGPDMTKRANASDPKDGYGTLYGHHSQKGLRADIGKNMTNADLLREAAKYDMEQLVQNAIQETPQIAKDCPGLLSYAKTLDKMADPYRKLGETPNADKPRKVVATGGVKPEFGQASQPQPVQAQATGQNQTATTGLNTTLTSGTTVPPALISMMHNLNLPGIPNSTIDNNGNYLYCISMMNGASNPQALQTLANNLPQGMSVTTHSNGNAYIINTADYQGYWSNYNHQIVQPQTQASGGSTASSQQQPASKPASTQPSSSSSSSSTATSTPKFTYGSAGSLVKSGGFNDGNISTDISNLISSTGLQSVKGKMLLAPGTKLKTQGSIANNGDLYIGLPAGTKKSDLQAIANHLNNEYGQYGYSAYPMGGSWISIEPTKQNTMKPKKTATASAASTQKPAQTPASTPATSQTPPPATTSTQSTQTATTNPGGTSTSQPASTTAVASNQTTGQTSATPTVQTAVQPPPRKTLSQMIQQRLASANPQQQARFQAALNRANGNSGIPPQPQTPQGASQQPQTASQTSGQPTTPSGQQSQQTASTVLLTAPKSGNQPTPAQQKTIARFQQQIQNARTPTQKAAFQQALSRYFGAI